MIRTEAFFEEDLKADINEECSKFGTVDSVNIDRANEVSLLLSYLHPDDLLSGTCVC